VEMVVIDGDHRGGSVEETHAGEHLQQPPVPLLSIAMLVCGTRGDVQPFIALGLKLKVLGISWHVRPQCSRIDWLSQQCTTQNLPLLKIEGFR